MKERQRQEKSVFSDSFWCPTFDRITAVSECIWRQQNPSYWACKACDLGEHWREQYCDPGARAFSIHVNPWRTRRPKSGTRILDLREGDVFTIAGQEWIVTKKLRGGKLLMRPAREVFKGGSNGKERSL